MKKDLHVKQWILMSCAVVISLSGCARDKVARKIVFDPAVAGTVKVISFNIRYGTANDKLDSWPNRKDFVFDLLADSKADVIGMQEVLDLQSSELQKALPQYGMVSVGRDDGQSAGEACTILYRRDRFTLGDSGTFWFSNTPWEPASKHWGNNIPRICTWARLIEKSTGKAFYLYNVHLDHESQPSREKSTRLLAKEIAGRPSADPYVVTGDFNIGLNNPAMLYLQKIGFGNPYPRLTDSWQLVYPDMAAPGTFHGFTGQPTGDKIDHILVTDSKVLDASIDTRQKDGRYPSDHFPVTAVIRLYEP